MRRDHFQAGSETKSLSIDGHRCFLAFVFTETPLSVTVLENHEQSYSLEMILDAIPLMILAKTHT